MKFRAYMCVMMCLVAVFGCKDKNKHIENVYTFEKIDYSSVNFVAVQRALEQSPQVHKGIFKSLTIIDQDTLELIVGDDLKSMSGRGEMVIVNRKNDGTWKVSKVSSLDF